MAGEVVGGGEEAGEGQIERCSGGGVAGSHPLERVGLTEGLTGGLTGGISKGISGGGGYPGAGGTGDRGSQGTLPGKSGEPEGEYGTQTRGQD